MKRELNRHGNKEYGQILAGRISTGRISAEHILVGAIIDKNTVRRTKKVKGGEVGVNGIWADPAKFKNQINSNFPIKR